MPIISLRVVFVLLVAVVAIIAASCAMLPVYFTGIASVKHTAAQLRGEISDRLQSYTTIYFETPMTYGETLADNYKWGLVDIYDWNQLGLAMVILA